MNRFTIPSRVAWAVLFALGALTALAGCSKKIVATVDAGYTTLEGRPDAKAQLLAWFDEPDTSLVFEDVEPAGPDLPSANARVDVLIGRRLNYRSSPGVSNLLVLDGTAASGYQFFRRADNGGLQAITDYTIPASMKWPPSGWEVYSLSDTRPSAYMPATYVARGLLEGRVTTISPLTNEAIPSGPTPRATIDVRYIRNIPPRQTPPLPRDSSITWTTTPGAAAYWLDLYRFKSTASVHELIASGSPTPVMTGSVTHVLVARFDGIGAPATMSYQLGSQVPGTLMQSPIVPGLQYLARVTAVDAYGRVIAWTHSRTQDQDPYYDDWLLQQDVGFYTFYPLAATPFPPPLHP